MTNCNPFSFDGRINRGYFFINLVILRATAGCLSLALFFTLAPLEFYLTDFQYGLLLLVLAVSMGVGLVYFEIGNIQKRVRDIQGCENPHWLWTVGYLFPIVNIAIYLYLQFARSTSMPIPASSS